MQNNGTVSVEIFGKLYPLSFSSEREKNERIQLAKIVNEKMNFYSKKLNINNISTLAILTALNLASDLMNKDEKADTHSLEVFESDLDFVLNEIDNCLNAYS
jgi:cell division protein ZapA (FtsZ GTPase activity inhibitor)